MNLKNQQQRQKAWGNFPRSLPITYCGFGLQSTKEGAGVWGWSLLHQWPLERGWDLLGTPQGGGQQKWHFLHVGSPYRDLENCTFHH